MHVCNALEVAMPRTNQPPELMPDLTSTKQGPMRLVDLMDRLATEDAVARDFALNSGRNESDAHYRAWQWCCAVCLNNPRPELPWHAEQALQRIQQAPRDLYGFRQY